ncbi:MBL fold metallo-hydrolase [Streptomyces violens]|uniref:MBL fold metallo-hydrolase n=1 Tax=Streptomyces violens TaxID=66377 RepID=UPI0004C05849|nr:MBL fold metallo-hydrolase [Streptomyces violens]
MPEKPTAGGPLSRRRLLAATGAATLAGGTAALGATPASATSRIRPLDGPRLVLLGTAAGPPPERTRRGIASALVVDGRTYVIDCGRSAVTQYQLAGLKLADLTSIFLTHLHADHIADYYNFFLLGAQLSNDEDDLITEPVDVYGPGPAGALPPAFDNDDPPVVAPHHPTPGLKRLTEKQIEAFAYSTNVFIRDSGIADPRTLVRTHEIELPEGTGAHPLGPTAPPMEPFEVADDGTVRVTAILVDHGPVFPSYAFRFDTAYGSVVFSGDTVKHDNVVRIARGADLLVHEVMDADFYRKAGLPPAYLDHMLQSHTDVTEVGPIAEAAGVDTLVLSHICPADPKNVSSAEWRRRAGKGFSGRVIAGEDLQQIPLRRR